jgi:hypothetical protein
MARRSASRVAVGNTILFGMPGVSMPSDWCLARVLWTDDKEMMTRHQPHMGADTVHQVSFVTWALRVGSPEELLAYKARCAGSVRRLRAKVDASEQRLGEARKAVWAAIDKMGGQP